MRFEVTYLRSKAFSKRGLFAKGRFYGSGRIHVHDTGLILEGELPKFHIPLLGTCFRSIICEWTSRTIPYSKITRYKATIPAVRRYHRLVFELPNQERAYVLFKMKTTSRELNGEFARVLEEHRSAFAPAMGTYTD
jgi:hypothetical protein